MRPCPIALDAFLRARRTADPEGFGDLSLRVVKMLGSGEYLAAAPGAPNVGHFGLAVNDYAHSTAPNRRYPDLVTQRLLKAAVAREEPPYALAALETIARHCTLQEDNASKVERQVLKAAAAFLLHDRIGERFDAIVTGAAPKGTYVRIARPLVEGRLVRGTEGVDVGDVFDALVTGAAPKGTYVRIHSPLVDGRLVRGFEGVDVGDVLSVRLLAVDEEQGFLDFARV